MTTLEKIRASLQRVRRVRGKTSFVSFVIAECEKPGKSKGNRESTEDEVQAVLKKLIDNTVTCLNLMVAEGQDTTELQGEITYLKSFRPEMVTEDTLREFIEGLLDEGKNMGEIMKAVKAEYGATADMKLASSISRQVQ